MEDRIEQSESASVKRRDPRLLVIALAGIFLLGAVAVAALGGPDDDASPAAPARCIDAWNSDGAAKAYGRHNYGAHGYERVQVRYLTAAGEPAEPGEGECAVVFGALELDSEPAAAGQLLRKGEWQPLALVPGVELTRLAELQQAAFGSANASLTGEGQLVAAGASS